MDVRMPDGTVVKGVPEGITKEDLTERLAAQRIAKAQGVDANDVLARLRQSDPARRDPSDVSARTPERSSVVDKILGTLGQAAQRSAQPSELPAIGRDVLSNIQSAGVGAGRKLLGVGQAQLDIASQVPDALNLPRALFGQEKIDRLKSDLTLAGNVLGRADEGRGLQGDIMRPVGGLAVDLAATKGIPIPGLGQRGLAPLAKRVATGTGFGAGIAGTQFEKTGDPGKRLEKAKFGAAIGGGIPLATGAIGGVSRFVASPIKSVLAPIVAKATKTPQFARFSRIEKSTGLKLSVAQKSGDPVLINIEQGTRTPLLGAKKAMEQTNKELRNQVDSINKVWKTFSKRGAKSEDIGRRLEEGYDNVITAASNKRSLNGRILFGAYDKISKNIGIPMKNYISVLKGIQRDAGAIEKNVLGKQVAGILKKIQNGIFSGKQFKNDLSFLSTATKGKGGILDKVSFGRQKEVAVQLIKAMEKDISVFSKELQKQGLGDAAKSLKIARDTWRFDSQGIDNYTKNALGKLIGKGGKNPEDIAKSFIRLPNSAKRAGFEMLKDVDRKLEGDVKASIVKSALEKSQKFTGKSVAENPFDPISFLAKTAPTKQARTEILSTFKGREIRRVAELLDGMRAAGSTFTPIGKQQAGSFLVDAMGNAFGGNPIFMARMFGKLLGPTAVSKYLRDPAGRELLSQFINASKINSAASAQRAVAAIHGLQNIEKQKEK